MGNEIVTLLFAPRSSFKTRASWWSSPRSSITWTRSCPRGCELDWWVHATRPALGKVLLVWRRRVFQEVKIAVCFQAIPGTQDGPSADGAQAAKRPRLPSGPAPPAQTSTETVESSCPLRTSTVTAPAERHSIKTPPTSTPLLQHSTTAAKGFQMDTSATLASASTSDPMLTPQSTPFQSMLNSDPLLSSPSPPPPPQHLVDNYILSTGYVSYMETLLSAHFPQDDEPAALY